jgi:DtxR family Mn-dependent transcriptional regulator
MQNGKRPRPEAFSLAQQRYIETIDDLQRRDGHAHVTELAEAMRVSKPSVVEAVQRLGEAGVVTRRDKEIVLTNRGQGVARELSGRHAVLRGFMTEVLGMDAAAADRQACRIEHVADPDFVRRLDALRQRVKQ